MHDKHTRYAREFPCLDLLHVVKNEFGVLSVPRSRVVVYGATRDE